MTPTGFTMPTSRRQMAGWTAVAVIAATVVALLGVSLWPLVITSAIAWWVALHPRVGPVIALGIIGPGAAVVLLALLLLTGATGAPALAVIISAFAGIGLLGSAALARSAPATSPVGPDHAPLWVPALLGPAVWLAAHLGGASSGAVSRLSWVMLGDSSVNLLYARTIMSAGGLMTGSSENPVPLPSALIAVSSWAGRAGVDGPDLLRHDLLGFVVVWSLLIAATCFTAGLAAAVTVGGRRPRLAGLAGALGSLLPLSWFVSGYAIQFGFFNAHVVLPVIFLSWAVSVRAHRCDEAAVLALLLATTVLLATWTPLALVPAALAASIALRRGRSLLTTRGGRIMIGAGLAQAAACTALIALPGLAGEAGALNDDGDVYPLSPWVPAVALLVAAAVFVVARRRADPAAGPLAAVTIACAIGIGVLVVVNLGQPRIWNYYPVKLAWLSCIVALIVLTSMVVRLVSSTGHPERAWTVGVALAGIVATTLVVAPLALRDRPPINAVLWVMAGSPFHGDGQVADIIRGADPGRPGLQWQTGRPNERDTNFWILRMLSDHPSEQLLLYRASTTYRPGSVADLCGIARVITPELTAYTADAGLSDELTRACPDVHVRVVVEASGRSAPSPG